MAKAVVKSTRVSLGGTAYEAQVKSATLSVSGPEVDVSNFESDGWAELLVGTLKATLALEFVKDADFSGLDAAMWAALGGTLAFVLRPTSAVKSASNPEYSGTVVVNSWSPISGAVGSALGGSVTFPVTGKVTRTV